MASQSRPRNVNCYSCAKRKVKCDRSDPCSHCRRRRDKCIYPSTLFSFKNIVQSQPSHVDDASLKSRLNNLEHYVRLLGGDPDRVPNSSLHDQEQLETSNVLYGSNPNGYPDKGSPSSTSATTSNISRADHSPSESLSTGTLVEIDNKSAYIEAPMWFSWSDAMDQAKEPNQDEVAQSFDKQPQLGILGQSSTVLDPKHQTGKTLQKHPSPRQVLFLWSKFLTNVHPLVKIFFAWDKEPIIQKAAEDYQSLSMAEETLVFAIYFIAILSLSDEECNSMMLQSKSKLLDQIQPILESCLQNVGFISTSDLIVLQAFLLYLLAMQNRTNPPTLFSLMGIAVRIAERLGLHRDGTSLKLSVFATEERRRIWWQMQHMEIIIGKAVGYLPVSMWADWDSKLPSNLEDDDFHPNIAVLPPERPGLTSMSHCLWRYFILHWKRSEEQPDRTKHINRINPQHIPMSDRESIADSLQSALRLRFLQFCEPLNPLHVHIQISIQSLFLTFKRTMYQPSLVNAKISEMSWKEREDYLNLCTQTMEYYIHGETTESIKQFSWHRENYFQWTAFGYLIIEAYHRAKHLSAPRLWALIDKCCLLHPKLLTETCQAEVSSIRRLILKAWYQREAYLQQLHQENHLDQPMVSRPESIIRLLTILGMKERENHNQGKESDSVGPQDASPLSLRSFSREDSFPVLDFDAIDWTFWLSDSVLSGPALEKARMF